MTSTPIDKSAFRHTFMFLAEFLAVVVTISLLFALLLRPYFGESHSPRATIPRPSDDAYLLDCFIIRDASKSPDSTKYGDVEKAILRNLNTSAGDRVSYAIFGSDTKPSPVQPPSSNRDSIEAQMKLYAGKNIYDSTNFAFLFDQLRKTIYQDREAQGVTKRAPHADAIIILSDGIPDSSGGKSECPKPEAQFVPDNIIKSVDALLNTTYATTEPIYVRLVLIGTPPLCAPRIKQEWERRIGDIHGADSFKVLSYSEGDNLEEELLFQLRLNPRIILSMAQPGDLQRESFDRTGKFAIQYSAQAFRQEGQFSVTHGALVAQQGEGEVEVLEKVRGPAPGEISLLAVKDPSRDYTDPANRVSEEVPRPSARRLLGEARIGSIYFKLENQGDEQYLSNSAKYELRVRTESTALVEYLPINLSMEPCRKTENNLVLRRKLQYLAWIPSLIGVVFVLGALYWSLTPEKPVTWLRARIEKALVEPYRRWIEVALVFIVPITGCLIYLQVGEALVGLGLMIALLLFFLDKVKESPTTTMLIFTIEFLLLPLVHLMYSSK